MNKRFLLISMLGTSVLTAAVTLGISQFLSTQNRSEEVNDPIVKPQAEEESTSELTPIANPIEEADPTGMISKELINRNWIKADVESEKYLMKTLDKGSLTPDDIAQLQCEALREVDQLWDTSSGGAFGYSNVRYAYLSSSADGGWNTPPRLSYLSRFEASVYFAFFAGTSDDQIASIPLQSVFITAIAPKLTQGSVERFLAINSRLEECGIGEVPQVDHYYYCEPASGFQGYKHKQYADDNIRPLMVASYYVRNLPNLPTAPSSPSYYLVDEGCPPDLIASEAGAEYKKCFGSYIPATDNECNLWKDYDSPVAKKMW